MRSTNHEFTGRIHMIGDVLVKKSENFGIVNFCNDTGHQDVDDVLADRVQHL